MSVVFILVLMRTFIQLVLQESDLEVSIKTITVMEQSQLEVSGVLRLTTLKVMAIAVEQQLFMTSQDQVIMDAQLGGAEQIFSTMEKHLIM
jgi:hypothetical protein